MLKEAIQAISEQAVKATGPRSFRPDAEPGHVYYLQKSDGSLERHEAEPQPRNHVAFSLEAIAKFAAKYKDSEFLPAIWYNRDQVVCLCNDESRLGKVTLRLPDSPQMGMLSQLEKNKPHLSQAEIVLMLRTMFKGMCCSLPALVDILRKVQFDTRTTGQGEIKQGMRSVGRDVESRVAGTGAIPEYVTFEVPAFHGGVDVGVRVECVLEANPEKPSFQVFPLPGQLERAWAEAEVRVKQLLEEELGELGVDNVPVYYGSCS